MTEEPHKDKPDNIRWYTAPPATDSAYWEANIAAGLHQPIPQPAQANGSRDATGFAWTSLADPQYATPPAPPAIHGILYSARRHVISGPPESAKTLIAYLLLLEALRTDTGVAILDFEMGPHAAATLLRELGATNDELENIHYTEPTGPPTSADIERILGLGIEYVLIDAAAGAYDTTGLDDNKRADAEKFASAWIRPLWQDGIATIVIDHVVKDPGNRGKFAIGSERKTGQADVHLSLETLKPLHRGSSGLVKIHVHKDRPGHLERPNIGVVELTSDPDTHQIGWQLKPAEHIDDNDVWRPTILMGRVSDYLEQQDEPVSKNQIVTNIKGNDGHLYDAITHLIALGHAVENPGARGAKLISLVTRYTPPLPGLPTSASPLPAEVTTTSAKSPYYVRGLSAEVGEAETDITSANPPDIQTDFSSLYDPDELGI